MTESAKTLIRPGDIAKGLAHVERDISVLLFDGAVLVTVAQFVEKGTLEQGALFHKLCEHISDWSNARYPKVRTSKETVKESIKAEFGIILTEFDPITGNRRARLESWSRYPKKKRADLITATLAWMASRGIPDLPEIEVTEYEGWTR